MALVSLSSYDEEFARSVQLPKCNTEACGEKFAPCFNRGTNTYYCTACARAINRANPEMKLVETIDDPDVLMGMHELFQAGRQYVGTTTLEDHIGLLSTGWGGSNPSDATLEVRKQLAALQPVALPAVRMPTVVTVTRFGIDAVINSAPESVRFLVRHVLRRDRWLAQRRKKAARERTGRR